VPSSVNTLLSAAGLAPEGVVHWGEIVRSQGRGIYVVALAEDPRSLEGALPECPIAPERIAELLSVRPELTLDGRRPSPEELAARIASFWLPDEVVLYIGKTDGALQNRVGQYYRTPLGARRPHSGGWFLKTLGNLNDLWVHYATTEEPVTAESSMLAHFMSGVSAQARKGHPDPALPTPFANLEVNEDGGRRRRNHGIRNARGAIERRPDSATTSSDNAGPERRRTEATNEGSPLRVAGGGHRTQRVTANDLENGQIRIPAASKPIFPSKPKRLEIVLRGRVLTDVLYRPSTTRSGILGIGKAALNEAVQADELLEVRRDQDGPYVLD